MFSQRMRLMAALGAFASMASPIASLPMNQYSIPFWQMGTTFKRSRVGAYIGMSINRKARNRIRNRIAARSRAANR